MGVQEFVWTSEHDSKQVERSDSVMIFRRFRRGRRPRYRVSARFPGQPASFIR